MQTMWRLSSRSATFWGAAILSLALACGDDGMSSPPDADMDGRVSPGDAGAGETDATVDGGSTPDASMQCGDAICERGQICVLGTCFVSCTTNGDCSGAQLCFAGRCASSPCEGIECAAGNVCAGGACRNACEHNTDCGGDRCLGGACYEVPNVPPDVNAGLDQSVAETSAVTVSGSAVDSDGSIMATIWTQLSGPAVVLMEEAATLHFTAPRVDADTPLDFELRAFDDAGAEASDTVTITVVPVAEAPIANAGDDFESHHDVVVNLTGSATDDDPIAAWAWTQVAGPDVAISSADQPNATFDAPVVTMATELVFRLTVTDADGTTDSDDVTVTLLPLNTPPIVNAGPNQVVASGDTVTLSGSASDPNLSTATVDAIWTQVAGTMVTLDGADTFTPTFVAPDVDCIESLAFELRGTDASGTSIRDTTEVTVLASSTTVEPGTVLDFEDSSGGGLSATGTWEHGAPTSGVNTAFSGANVWATVLDGPVPADGTSYLTLPPVDFSSTADPVLSFRMWVRAGPGADGLSVEINNGSGWGNVPQQVHRPYDVDGLRWSNTRGPRYELIDVDLAALASQHACIRFAFFADDFLGVGVGAYVDDVGLHSDASDPDGDGLLGVRTERETYGTDPFVGDSDMDGVDDGDEVMDMTNPANPADHSGAVVWTPGTMEDFESDDGGLAAWPGFQWEHGSPDDGPRTAHSGGSVWGTNLTGSYTSNAVDYVYLPVVDLRDATDPTLSMFLWSRAGLIEAHGANVQIRAGSEAWTSVDAQITPYTATHLGQQVWNNVLGQPSDTDAPYQLVALSLTQWAGQRVELRVGFYSAGGRVSAGAYIDDISIFEETDDPDEDGLAGVIDELQNTGTHPFVADSDGDTVIDGTEIDDGTNPLNPAVYSGAPTISVGHMEDFENPSGGSFATDGSAWEHGFPSAGPGAPYSGSFVWGTNLTGNVFSGATEYVYLPELDLSSATNPTLSLRFWTASGLAEPDGSHVQVLTDAGWQVLAMQVEPYNRTISNGPAIWNEYRDWTFAAGSLAAFVGQQVQLRIAWLDLRGGRLGSGTYIDDVSITEEDSDPDGDGIAGVIAESMSHGTDPFVADTDGDGADDNTDAAPLDPSIQ